MKACKNNVKQKNGRQRVGGIKLGGASCREHSHCRSFNIQINMSQKKKTEKNRGVEIIQKIKHFLKYKHIYKGH